MEVDEQARGKTGSTCMAARPSTRYSFRRAPGSPHSTHTDTDVAMKMGGLGMASGG